VVSTHLKNIVKMHHFPGRDENIKTLKPSPRDSTPHHAKKLPLWASTTLVVFCAEHRSIGDFFGFSTGRWCFKKTKQ